MSYIVHQDETRDMGAEVSNVLTEGDVKKRASKTPRPSRAKPKVSKPTDPDAPVAKVRALGTRGSRKKKEGKAELSEAKVEIVAEGGFASQAPQDFQDTGNIKLDPPALVRESVLISAETRETESPKAELSASKKPRGRPPIDKWATVEARIRGGEFASDCSAIPSKAKLAIYISRVLAEDNAFRPRMKDLLTELGHADLLSVFALR